MICVSPRQARDRWWSKKGASSLLGGLEIEEPLTACSSVRPLDQIESYYHLGFSSFLFTNHIYHVLLLRLPLPLFISATGLITKRYSDLGVVKDPALGRNQARRIDCGYGTCGLDLIVGRKSGIGAGIGPSRKWRD